MQVEDTIESKFRDPLTRRIALFLRAIGLPVRAGTVEEATALPGIRIDHATLVVDEKTMTYPGDLLHEAGHLAVVPPARRAGFHHDVGNEPGEEMAAIAWSFAAATHLGIAPEIVFHAAGYRGSSEAIVGSFAMRLPVGVPILAWRGMTVTKADAVADGPPPFPHMTSWLCSREDPP
jgi:hypothetical protein